jgi:hypothetical protein
LLFCLEHAARSSAAAKDKIKRFMGTSMTSGDESGTRGGGWSFRQGTPEEKVDSGCG